MSRWRSVNASRRLTWKRTTVVVRGLLGPFLAAFPGVFVDVFGETLGEAVGAFEAGWAPDGASGGGAATPGGRKWDGWRPASAARAKVPARASADERKKISARVANDKPIVRCAGREPATLQSWSMSRGRRQFLRQARHEIEGRARRQVVRVDGAQRLDDLGGDAG